MDSSKLAAYLASRICHDIASPLTPLVQSCELLFDEGMGPAMRAEGEKALRNAISTLEAKVRFMRFAVGTQAINDNHTNVHEARDLFAKLFAVNSKTELDWRVETTNISNRQMRLLMNMTLIMIEPAAKGICRVSAREDGDKLLLDVDALGQFSQIKPEVHDALAGKEPRDGWGGGAIQPYFASLLADEIGFSLAARTEPRAAGLTARGPRLVA
ncbi:MAG: histidine phosphotransferase family protein [Alphaproteobacteria bacterium]